MEELAAQPTQRPEVSSAAKLRGYIVDFYCPSEKLVIELDGSAHDSEEAWKHDQQRSEFLRSLKLRVLRFENCAVMENLEGVLSEIARNLGVK